MQSKRSPIDVAQSWAHLEEQEGAYQRAQELRNFSLQEQTSFVPPLNLGPDAAVDPIFSPILGQVSYSPCMLHPQDC